MPDDEGKEWITIAEASERFGISERTIWRRIQHSIIEAKMEAKPRRRLVLVESIQASLKSDTPDASGGTSLTGHLQEENKRLWKRVEDLEAQLKAKDEITEQAKERSDTIILQLTRQFEQSQRLLEHKSEPWHRRIFRRTRKPDGPMGQ